MGAEVRGDRRCRKTVREDWKGPQGKGHRNFWKMEKTRKLVLLRPSGRKVAFILAPVRPVVRFSDL